MKKFSVSAVLFGVLFGIPVASNGAYPAYPSYQANVPVSYTAGVANGQMVYLPSSNSQVVATNGIPVQNTVMQPQPTRITGALPRVGSTQSVAGRQYYQPADYDRLADSGLYVGLSVGYTASLMGSMSADYQNEQNAFFVPGAFKDADFDSDTVIPLQISVGAAINNDIRVDFSYLRYSGIAYPKMVQTADGAGGLIDAQVDGGAITSNTTMLNVYYNIDSYTGYLAGGVLRPYIGAGVGISLNTIADYVVYDNTFYSEMDPIGAGAGDLTGISDIYAYHNGGTTEQLAFMLEGGLTTEMDGGIKLDFFVRYANLGKVKTSGSIIVSQTEWLGDGAGGEYEAPYDSVFHYTNWYESGRLGMVDLGIRMRLQF
ncbi:MAG: hypothetical protein J6S06_00465 [Alphaproteobacteria bacterium]|nr:hypothetical protein [Alphaproteobacteria bacterium]